MQILMFLNMFKQTYILTFSKSFSLHSEMHLSLDLDWFVLNTL